MTSERQPDFWLRAAQALIELQPADRWDELWMTFNERAGIAQYCGNLFRPDAERLAFHELRVMLRFRIPA